MLLYQIRLKLVISTKNLGYTTRYQLDLMLRRVSFLTMDTCRKRYLFPTMSNISMISQIILRLCFGKWRLKNKKVSKFDVHCRWLVHDFKHICFFGSANKSQLSWIWKDQYTIMICNSSIILLKSFHGFVDVIENPVRILEQDNIHSLKMIL